MYPAADKNLTYETEDTVYFFTNPFYPLDNYSAHTVNIWGHTFNTVEHAFQWKKFSETNSQVAEQIKQAGSPELAKKLAKSNPDRRTDWSEVKVSIMVDIIRAKVDQHPDVQEMLISTGSKQIVENSPEDNFWGAGPDGHGQNQMGKILMQLREEIRQPVQQ